MRTDLPEQNVPAHSAVRHARHDTVRAGKEEGGLQGLGEQLALFVVHTASAVVTAAAQSCQGIYVLAAFLTKNMSHRGKQAPGW